MPKFYKQNILATHTQVVSSQPPLNHASSFMPEEPLLPSPLDTLEIAPPVQAAPSQPALQPTSHPEMPTNPQVFSENNPQNSLPEPTSHTNQTTAPIPENHLVQTLLSWRAPSRPHRKKDRSFYTTVAILIILIAMIALLAGERMLVAVLFALMFLVYVLNFIEPQEIEYKLSTQGITIDEHFYHWQELDSFWFEKKDGYTVLHILTQLRFPSMLMLVLGLSTSEEDVKRTTARFLPFHEIPPHSVIDKWAQTMQKYLQLENPHK